MFERFTRAAREATVQAQEQARRLGHDRIGTEHLLLGLLAAEGGVAAKVLRGLGLTTAGVEAEVTKAHGRGGLGPADAEALATIGINLDQVRAHVEERFGPGALRPAPSRRRGRGRHIPFTDEAKTTLERSLREALKLQHDHIGTEHMLLALTTDPALGGELLRSLGAAPPEVRAEVIMALRRAS